MPFLISGYFRTVNMSRTQKTWSDKETDVVTKTVLTPLIVLGDICLGVATALLLVVNTTSTAIVDTIETVSPFPVTRDKRIQYPIPPRYKECK